MARDRSRRRSRRRGAPPAAGRDSEPTPIEQLDTWRNWRHDTAEFAPYPAPDELGSADGPTEVVGATIPVRRRRRPGTGLLIGLAVVTAALMLGGLAAAGIGPVRNLLGSHPADPTPSTIGTPAAGNTTAGAAGRPGRRPSALPSTNAPSRPEPGGPAAGGPAAPGPGKPGAEHPGRRQPGAPPGGTPGP